MALFERKLLVDHVGAHRTQSLFLETNNTPGLPIMTLKELDWEYKGRILPSLRRLYMEANDPTEYTIAHEVFGSWKQWKRLCKNKIIGEYIQELRDELEVRLRSDAIKAMVDTATLEGAKGTTAAKYIAERGWNKRKAGAPSKEEKNRELKIQDGISDEIQEDMARLELH